MFVTNYILIDENYYDFYDYFYRLELNTINKLPYTILYNIKLRSSSFLHVNSIQDFLARAL